MLERESQGYSFTVDTPSALSACSACTITSEWGAPSAENWWSRSKAWTSFHWTSISCMRLWNAIVSWETSISKTKNASSAYCAKDMTSVSSTSTAPTTSPSSAESASRKTILMRDALLLTSTKLKRWGRCIEWTSRWTRSSLTRGKTMLLWAVSTWRLQLKRLRVTPSGSSKERNCWSNASSSSNNTNWWCCKSNNNS